MEILLISILFAACMKVSLAAYIQPSSCQTKCGDVDIPYPFGIGDRCYIDAIFGNFEITCKDNSRAYLGKGNVEVYKGGISTSGEIRVITDVGHACYKGGILERPFSPAFNLSAPLTFSHTKNKFSVLGCDTYAYIIGKGNLSYTGGCMALCANKESLNGVPDGNCTGVGCCEVSIPMGLVQFSTTVGTFDNYTKTENFNRCGYIFLAEQGDYKFKKEDLQSERLKNQTLPLVLDWSLGSIACEKAKTSVEVPFACNEMSECVESNNGVGYFCKCKDGYDGNPYLEGGCKDIDECLQRPNVCRNGACNNIPGNYTCICDKGFESVEGIGCQKIERVSLGEKLGIGIGGGFLVILAASALICWGRQRRTLKDQSTKMAEFKKRMFEQNGGPLLEQQISSQQRNGFRIFTEEELNKATSGFADEQIVGRGGHGIVYLGKMEDNTVVAIKKSRKMDERESKEFAREMVILSQINHVNVVKILGCCMEVEIPMLVYEFVPGGTLYDLIHGPKGKKPISFWVILRIAQEVADALAYLHSYASPPILHKDIKTSNVLLDENNKAKISDFGASSVAPIDENEVATVVQGTCGYLDPEYLQSYQFTDKSDVYSFGVVLVELLTRRKPFQLVGPEDQKGLATSFINHSNQGKLDDILDPQIVEEAGIDILREICELAVRCLCMKRSDRPTMKEVSMALQIFESSHEHPWVPQHSPSEVRNLLDCDQLLAYDSIDIPSSYMGTNYHTIHDIEGGR